MRRRPQADDLWPDVDQPVVFVMRDVMQCDKYGHAVSLFAVSNARLDTMEAGASKAVVDITIELRPLFWRGRRVWNRAWPFGWNRPEIRRRNYLKIFHVWGIIEKIVNDAGLLVNAVANL